MPKKRVSPQRSGRVSLKGPSSGKGPAGRWTLPKPIDAGKAFRHCPSNSFKFKDTTHFGKSHDIISQDRAVRAINAEVRGVETVCEITGVERQGRWVTAYAVKVADSSDGVAFLIYGGAWGIRLRSERAEGDWDLANREQWGEPFKVYGSEEDIHYANE